MLIGVTQAKDTVLKHSIFEVSAHEFTPTAAKRYAEIVDSLTAKPLYEKVCFTEKLPGLRVIFSPDLREMAE